MPAAAPDAEAAWEDCAQVQKLQLQPPPSDPSPLSQFFARMRELHSPEARTDATLSDVVDSALRSLHQVSQRHKPSVQGLMEGFPPPNRQEMLVWLLQAFDVMHFSDSLLFDTALLLDRYYAQQPREDGAALMHRKLLAAVCTALKTGSPLEVQQQLPSLRHIVTHLAHNQVPFDEVLQAELCMLRKLRFQVGTPTSKEFLEAFAARLGADRVGTATAALADFLLQLSLVDAPLHYRYPHAVLAASALGLALHATRAPSSAYAALLEDFSLHYADEQRGEHQQGERQLVQCMAALHMLWLQSQPGPQQNTYSRSLYSKFGKPVFHTVSHIAPPAYPPSSLPPATHSFDVQRMPQDELGEAAALLHQSLNIGEDSQWINSGSILMARLRVLAEASWKVRWVLARHGWASGRFRTTPDREAVLRDLVTTAKGGVHRKEVNRVTPQAIASQPSQCPRCRRNSRSTEPQNSLCLTCTNMEARIAGGARSPSIAQRSCGSSMGSAGGRRRRAASWSGQRCSGRCPIVSKSPGPPPRSASRPALGLRAASVSAMSA